MANYELTIAHLYGNLMNTYGDNGNLLMLKYVAKKLGITCHTEIVSITIWAQTAKRSKESVLWITTH